MYITILLIIYNLLFFYLFKHKKNLNNDYDKEKNKYNRLKTKKITRIINIGYISINLIYLLIVFLSINLDIIDNLLIYTVIFILYILIYLFIELNTKIYRTKLKIIDKKIINNKDILYIITSYILFIIEKISISYNLSKMNTNEYNFINIFNIILYLVCTILILILITYLIIYVFRNKSYFVYSNIDENYLQDIRFYKKIEFKKIANHIIYITAFIVFYYIRIPFIYFFYIIVIISILYYIYNKINMIKKESSRVYKSITIAKNKPGVVYAFLFSKDLLLLRKIIIFEIMLFVSTIVYYGLGEGEFIIAAISIYLILLYTIIEDKIYLIRYLSSLNEEFINVDEYSIIENKKINYIETINLFGINLYRLIIVDTINYESNIIIYDPELVIEDIEIRINKSNIDDYIMLETYLYEE